MCLLLCFQGRIRDFEARPPSLVRSSAVSSAVEPTSTRGERPEGRRCYFSSQRQTIAAVKKGNNTTSRAGSRTGKVVSFPSFAVPNSRS